MLFKITVKKLSSALAAVVISCIFGMLKKCTNIVAEIPQKTQPQEAAGAAVRRLRLHDAVLGICPAADPESESGVRKLPGIPLLRGHV